MARSLALNGCPLVEQYLAWANLAQIPGLKTQNLMVSWDAYAAA